MTGQRVLITGAARGIGAETARRLAARGARVALLGLEPDKLAEVAAACGPGAHWQEVDVTDRDALEAAVEGAVQELGGLDVAMVNAGIAGVGTLRDMDPDAFERTIEVNLLGASRTLRACLPHLIASRGYVLTVASLAAIAHTPILGAYAASKAGVEALANSMRIEVSHHGVDVGVAYFSWIDTEMVRGGYVHPSYAVLRSRLRGPLAKTYPVAAAADAAVRGIERRARVVCAPGWVRALLPLRALAQRIGERDALAAMPDAEAAVRDDIERRGREEASRAVGAGGQADAAARR